MIGGINDYTDTAYYYTNSKYLSELSYYGLYATAIVCDQERGSPRTAQLRQYRDLRDYELRPIRVATEHGQQLKAEAFTPQRWASYCHDITYFLDRLSIRSLTSNFFVDHGYNPPPTWTLVGGNLAFLVPVEQLKLICWVDGLLVVGMFACIGWAFGIDALLFALLFYTVTFSGRWPILGQALMRVRLGGRRRLWHGLPQAGPARARGGEPGVRFAQPGLSRDLPPRVGPDLRVRHLARGAGDPAPPTLPRGAGIVTVLLLGGALLQYGPSTFGASAATSGCTTRPTARTGSGSAICSCSAGRPPGIRSGPTGGSTQKSFRSGRCSGPFGWWASPRSRSSRCTPGGAAILTGS